MSDRILPGHFMWFEASPTLRQDAETFIQNIHQGVRSPQNALLQRVVEAFVGQCMEMYFLVPAERVGLGAVGRKLVVTAVATLRKTLQMVLGRIVRKLGLREMRSLAEYMDQILLRPVDGAMGAAYVAFELEPGTVQRLGYLQQQSRAGGQTVPAQVIAAFSAMADEALAHLFADPLSGLTLGPVLGRLVQMGLDTSGSVINGLIRRIFSTMTQAQVAAALDYFCQQISSAEELGSRASRTLEWA